jgi:hypothetical protein
MNLRVLGNCIGIVTILCVVGLTAVHIWLLRSFWPSPVVVTTCIVAIVVNVVICAVAVWKRGAVVRSYLAMPERGRKPLLLASALSIVGAFAGGMLGNFALMIFSMGIVPLAFHYLQRNAARRPRERHEADAANSP